MTAHARSSLLITAVGFLLGLAALLVVLRGASAAGQPLDRVVASDHADHSATSSAPAPDLPVLRFQPTTGAEVRAWFRRVGENTGGAWLAALVAIGIRRARGRWPVLRRGWTDEVSATAFAAAAWVAGSLATGATWATAALGVVMAALAGTLLAVVPGEKPAADPKKPGPAPLPTATATIGGGK